MRGRQAVSHQRPRSPTLGITVVVDGDFARASMPTGFALDRPSIGTRTNSALTQVTESANVARFDYDPATGVLRGVLVEPAATNVLTFSDQFDNSAWFKSNASVTGDAAIAPNGLLVGDKLFESATNAAHLAQQNASFATGVTYAFSCFMKAGERTTAHLRLTSSGTTWGAGGVEPVCIFDLAIGSAGAVSNGALSGAVASIYPAGNGWYRCVLAATCQAASTSAVRCAGSLAGSNAYLGDGSSGFFLFGGELKVSAAGDSYIPTTTAAATRAADTLTTTLPYPCDVLIQDRNGAEWRDNQPAGTLVIAARAGQRHVVRVRAYAAGTVSPAMKAAMAVAI